MSYQTKVCSILASSPLLRRCVVCNETSLLFGFLLPLIRRGAMPRRGWSTAPDGWVQFLRGPRPPSHRWPMAQGNRQKPVQDVGRRSVGPPPAQVQVGQGPVHPQRRPESKPSVVRADPDSIREAARIRVIKLEKALEVMGDSQGPECLRSS